MTTSMIVARTTPLSSARGWLTFSGGLLIALYALLFGARPAHAQTVYHVDDSVNDGLIAYYKLEETFDGDNLAWDIIGGAHGTTEGGANFVNTQLPSLQGQNFGKLDMPGNATDQVLINDTLINFGNEFTVAVWVKRDQINEFHAIFDAGTGLDNQHWYVAIGDAGAKNNAILFGRRNLAEIIGTTAIDDTNWHHIALSHSADNTLRMYLDGVLDLTVASITLSPLSGAQRIGAVSVDNTSGIAGNFDGSLDELRLYNRALSLTEIERLANGFGCVTDGLSWAAAFPDLNCALEIGTFGDTIRVAKGRYLPGINPEALFDIDAGDNIQGGFDGNEALNESRPPLNLDPATPGNYLDSSQYTILTGDLSGNDPLDALTDPNTVEDEEADNLQRIFSIITVAVGTSLDGVVVTGARNHLAGGGVRILGSPTISNAIFVFNRADYGGGLFIPFNTAPNLSNLRFIGNEALIFGGGIETESFITLDNTRFISNTAGVSGGGLDVREDGALLTNVDFERNRAPVGGGLYVSPNITSFSYTAGELAQNEADSGGGIYTEAAATFTNLTLRANQAITQGGGIYSQAPITVDSATILSNTQTALSSSPDVGGGGIYSRNGLTLTHSTLQGNSADTGGGVLAESLQQAASLLIDNTTFRTNHSTNNNGGGIQLRANQNQLTARLTDVTFEGNFTQDDEGGGLAANSLGSAIALTALRLTVNNNTASQSGGGVSLEGDVIAEITDSAFEGNEAGSQGGALFILGTQTAPQLTNLIFRNNHALTDAGGAISFCCTSATLQVENLLVEQNSSVGNGGGINACCGAGISGTFLTLQNNESSSNGGGLALCCGGESTLQFITVTANSAITNGGGIHLSGGANLTITNGLWTGNQSEALGGGVYTEFGASFNLTNGRLEGNHARTSGGGIFTNISTVRLTNVQIIRNTTSSSGGAGLSLTTSFDTALSQVEFIENSTGDDDGGAMRIRGGNASLDRVRFHGNAAQRGGGAIFVENGAIVTVTNAILVGNIGNSEANASDVSNAIQVTNGSKLQVINSSIAANNGPGTGVFRLEENSALTLTNVILWDNDPPTADNDGTGTLVEQNVITGSPVTGTDPRFSHNPTPGDGNWATLNDNDYGDLQLRSTSPALDRGDGDLLPAGISQDFNGNPRIFDVASATNLFALPVDLGAFEQRFVAPVANTGGPYQGNEGQAIALDGSLSSDDGTITTYEWDCTNDSTIDATSSSPTGQVCTYGEQGPFTLRLLVTDNDGIKHESTAAVTVDNVAPNAQNDNATTLVNQAVTIDVRANDTDVAADPLSLTAVNTPSSGSVAIVAGSVLYTPATDFTGNATFTYAISDGDGGSDTATVNVTVTLFGGDETIHLPLLSKE